MADPKEYSHLPGIFPELIDQGLSVTNLVRAPRVLVLGTASQGQTGRPYVVSSSSVAASEFGSNGTLTRGMYEVRQAGAKNVILYRLGATAAKLEHIGCTLGTGGYTVETIRRDDDAGSVYTVYYNDDDDRLIVYNSLTGVCVYDNDSSDPIDLGEVIVSGSRCGAGGPHIGGPSSTGVALEDVTAAGTSYTAGTDGLNPSRMELWEYLYKAYKDLESEDFDFVVPMDIYLDDLNVKDGDDFGATYIASIVDGGTYPTAGSASGTTGPDGLGEVFVEEYNGEYYFFWDLNEDGDAELWPDGVGSASATTKIDGTSLTSGDFHEVNFAYQLALFCHTVSTNNVECLGTVGVKPPSDLSRAAITSWVGQLPSYTTATDGTQTILSPADDGTGLLGNKFMAGKYNYRSGAAYGGFILTDSEFLDGTEETDQNGQVIDIGRYLSVVAAYLRFFNPVDSTGWGYASTAAPSYMGFVSKLDEKDAPTNQVFRTAQSIFTISARWVNKLTQAGYVYVFEKPKGLVVSDAPTGARPSSDFYRLTTMRIVKRCIDVFRGKADPFIGKAMSPANRAALETAVRDGLNRLLKSGYITRYELNLRQTPQQKVIGDMDAELILVPAWELRRIRLIVSLAME